MAGDSRHDFDSVASDICGTGVSNIDIRRRGCYRQLAQPAQALADCTPGRVHYPDDAEILFHEDLVRRVLDDPADNEAAFRRPLSGQEKAHFASVETSLDGSTARHNLAALYLEQGRLTEAGAQWREALAVEPDYCPAKPPAFSRNRPSKTIHPKKSASKARSRQFDLSGLGQIKKGNRNIALVGVFKNSVEHKAPSFRACCEPSRLRKPIAR